MKSKKEFDSVEMMRKIRDTLSKKYIQNPDKQKADLKKIHQELNLKTKSKKAA